VQNSKHGVFGQPLTINIVQIRKLRICNFSLVKSGDHTNYSHQTFDLAKRPHIFIRYNINTHPISIERIS